MKKYLLIIKKITPIKKFLTYIIINSIILILLLLTIENSIPYFTEINVGTRRYIRLDEYQPGSKIKYLYNNNIYERIVDKNGFVQDQKFDKNIIESQSIFLMGSSNLETLYVKDGERLSNYIFKNLESENLLFNLFNTSKGGLNTSHILKHLLFKVISKRPKYIVFMPGNDYSYLKNYGSYWNGPKQHFIKNNLFETVKLIKDIIFPNLYIVLRSTIEFQIPEIGIEDDFKENKLNFSDTAVEDEFKKIINLFIKACKIYDIKLIVCTQFYNNESDDFNSEEGELFKKGIKMLNEALRKAALENQIDLVDFEKQIPSDFDFMYDSGHLNEKGSKFASKLISRKIIELEKNENN